MYSKYQIVVKIYSLMILSFIIPAYQKDSIYWLIETIMCYNNNIEYKSWQKKKK